MLVEMLTTVSDHGLELTDLMPEVRPAGNLTRSFFEEPERKREIDRFSAALTLSPASRTNLLKSFNPAVDTRLY
jgi:hypothetical protein